MCNEIGRKLVEGAIEEFLVDDFVRGLLVAWLRTNTNSSHEEPGTLRGCYIRGR